MRANGRVSAEPKRRDETGSAGQLEIPNLEVQRNTYSRFAGHHNVHVPAVEAGRRGRRNVHVDPDRLVSPGRQLERKRISSFICVAVHTRNQRIGPLSRSTRHRGRSLQIEIPHEIGGYVLCGRNHTGLSPQVCDFDIHGIDCRTLGAQYDLKRLEFVARGLNLYTLWCVFRHTVIGTDLLETMGCPPHQSGRRSRPEEAEHQRYRSEWKKRPTAHRYRNLDLLRFAITLPFDWHPLCSVLPHDERSQSNTFSGRSALHRCFSGVV